MKIAKARAEAALLLFKAGSIAYRTGSPKDIHEKAKRSWIESKKKTLRFN